MAQRPRMHVSSLSLLRWDRMHARVLACGHELPEAVLRSAHGGGCVVQAELPRRSPERTGPWSRVARLASRREVAVRRRPPRSETPQLAKAFTVGRAVSA